MNYKFLLGLLCKVQDREQYEEMENRTNRSLVQPLSNDQESDKDGGLHQFLMVEVDLKM